MVREKQRQACQNFNKFIISFSQARFQPPWFPCKKKKKNHTILKTLIRSPNKTKQNSLTSGTNYTTTKANYSKVKNSAMPLFLWPWFCIVSSTMALMESRELQNDAMKESTFWSWILASLSHINRGDSIWVRTVSVAFLCILFGWGYDFSKRSFWFSKFFSFLFSYTFWPSPGLSGREPFH